MQKCVLFEILHSLMRFWDCIGRNTGSVRAEPPRPKQIIADYIYFEIVSLTTLDVY